ncbi:MAG: hypothetical protein HKM04_02540 [Legionellales bacterium]|nr:hypothetical protein [Legionellales bacterium]
MTSDSNPSLATPEEFNQFVANHGLQIAESQIVNIQDKAQVDAVMDKVVLTTASRAHEAELEQVAQNNNNCVM